MAGWNPWHGCKKYSEGCLHCYVYRIDAAFDRDASQIVKTGEFDLPRRRKRSGEFALQSGEEVYTCLSSDFFLEQADAWRPDAWQMMKERGDVRFHIITKRILRAVECLPADWGDGYANVRIGCTVESAKRAEERLPVFLNLPATERFVVCEPLLERIDLAPWLASGKISQVIAGGESGPDARKCDFAWILDLREQCARTGTAFHFKQTGANFHKDGRHYRIERRSQSAQARRAGIDYIPPDGPKLWTPGDNMLMQPDQLSLLQDTDFDSL